MNNKIQQRDEVLQALIEKHNFEPTGVTRQLYVNRKTGAVLSCKVAGWS